MSRRAVPDLTAAAAQAQASDLRAVRRMDLARIVRERSL